MEKVKFNNNSKKRCSFKIKKEPEFKFKKGEIYQFLGEYSTINPPGQGRYVICTKDSVDQLEGFSIRMTKDVNNVDTKYDEYADWSDSWWTSKFKQVVGYDFHDHNERSAKLQITIERDEE